MKDNDLKQTQQLIIFYSYFRVLLACCLILVGAYNFDFHIHQALKSPYLIIASSFLVAAIFQCKQSYKNKYSISQKILFFSIFLDIFTILVLHFLTESDKTGLGTLLITPICIASIFFRGNQATFFAAIATIGILAKHIYSQFTISSSHADEVQVGMLGMTFFAVSLGIQYLARYILQTQRQAVVSENKAQELAELNRHIVQRIRTGIIIFNDENQLILNNKAAQSFTYRRNNETHVDLRLLNLLNQWKLTEQNNHTLKASNSLTEMQINFSSLDSTGNIITFIDDISEVTQQAQQMKLASLGRLSASIAHEIRNPLNAISHSVQLLEESPDLSEKSDIRLLNIASNHIKRIDEIIRSILGMSRQKQYHPERINLNTFIQSIKEEYVNNHNYPQISFITEAEEQEVIAPFDSSQLHQVLSNLIDNGLRYSFQNNEKYKIRLQLTLDTNKAVLNIYDEGLGVPEENHDNLFEPFFTSETTGTGLGLYLSQELCTLNQSQLSYIHDDGLEHHFQIRFAHADRDILV